MVARAEGKRLAQELKPGQRLVSLEGDLWRWDGFVSAAEAPSAAARRLVEKNRLGDLEREAEAARQAAAALSAEAASAASATREAAAAETEWRAAGPRRPDCVGFRPRRLGAIRARARPNPFAPVGGGRGVFARRRGAQRGGRTQGRRGDRA